jgi:hypothetical protein
MFSPYMSIILNVDFILAAMIRQGEEDPYLMG